MKNEKNMEQEKVKLSIPEQVKLALDGRTQRWLSFEIRLPEQELSQKMKGTTQFTQDELDKISNRLNFKFEI